MTWSVISIHRDHVLTMSFPGTGQVEQSRDALQVGSKVSKPASNDGRTTRWQVLATSPFLDMESSPALTRILYIPRLSSKRNKYTTFALLQQTN